MKIGDDDFFLMQPGFTFVDLICVMRAQGFYTWLLKQKDNRAYARFYRQLLTNRCVVEAVISGIRFSEDVFVGYLASAGASDENLVAQLYQLTLQGYKTAVDYAGEVLRFVKICGPQDGVAKGVFVLTLQLVDWVEQRDPGDPERTVRLTLP